MSAVAQSSDPSPQKDSPLRPAPLQQQASSSNPVSAVEAAIEFWSTSFNLAARKEALDQQGLALSEAKDATQRARKKLAETTREYKKKSEAEKLSGFDELLKCYQEEIDNLTRRARASDAAFHTVYKDLYAAPDPAPLLTALLQDKQRLSPLELELSRMAREVEEYEAEFIKLKNQDITIRKLEEKVAEYESRLSGRVDEEVDRLKADIQQLADARVKEALEREAHSEEKAATSEAARQDAEDGRQRAEARLLQATRQAEERAAAAQAEYDLLLETCERHESDAAAVRQELKALQAKIQGNGAREEEGSVSAARARELERDNAEMAAAVTALRQRLVGKEEEYGRAQEQWAAARALLEQQLSKERADKVSLEAEVASRPTREEVEGLRGQVRVLQQLEFNVMPGTSDDDDGKKVAIDEAGDGLKGAGGGNPEETPIRLSSTEHVLLTRIRRLETEAMAARRDAADANAGKQQLAESLRSSECRVAELQGLVSQLEEDLSQLSSPQQPTRQRLASTDTVGSTSFNATMDSNESSSLEVDMAELLSTTSLPSSSKTSRSRHGSYAPSPSPLLFDPNSAKNNSGGIELGKIVAGQRDRYRQRLRVMEAEHEALVREHSRSTATMQALQRDNVQMYEKIRFLQAYNAQQAGGTGGARGAAGGYRQGDVQMRHPHAGAMGGDGYGLHAAEEGKYQALYEEALNPFTQWSAAERQRKYSGLSVAEKITLSTTRFFLQNRMARSFVFFYALGLHVLVSLTVFLWSAHHCDDLRRPVPLSHAHPSLPRVGGNELPTDLGSNAHLLAVPEPPQPQSLQAAVAASRRRRS